jgi:hypothetical protein
MFVLQKKKTACSNEKSAKWPVEQLEPPIAPNLRSDTVAAWSVAVSPMFLR